jgi:hypothetical protein
MCHLSLIVTALKNDVNARSRMTNAAFACEGGFFRPNEPSKMLSQALPRTKERKLGKETRNRVKTLYAHDIDSLLGT